MYCACTTSTVFGVTSTGDVLIFLVLVLVLCLYHCIVCTVLVPLMQCSDMASTGNVPFTRVCPRTVLVPLHNVYCACTPCTVVWHGQHGNVPILLVFVLVLCLYHCTVCTVRIPLVQCSGMASTGNVPNLPVFVLVLCVYRCTVCTVHVPLVTVCSRDQERIMR